MDSCWTSRVQFIHVQTFALGDAEYQKSRCSSSTVHESILIVIVKHIVLYNPPCIFCKPDVCHDMIVYLY